MNHEIKKRDPYWDAMKFVLIALVVYVHTLEAYIPEWSFNRAMYNFNIMFHMPIFIFISGRFSHIHDRKRYKNSFMKLFETYIVFQLIHHLIYFAHGKPLSFDLLIYPAWTLWYFLALIYWRFIIYIIPERWLQYRKSVLASSFIICLLAGFIPVDFILAIQKSFAYLPFFFLGYYSNKIDIQSSIRKIPIWVAIICLITTFGLFYFVLNKDYTSIQLCYSSYWAEDCVHTMMNCGGRAIFIISATIVSIMFMRCISPKKNIAKLGSKTMFIYVYHPIIIIFLNAAIIRNYIPQNKVLLIIYATTIVVGLILLSNSKYLNLLMNPLSSLKKLEIQTLR